MKLKNNLLVGNHTTHNLSHTKIYGIWEGIKTRCTNKKREDYPRYGGRGIFVCKEWIDSFETFYSDMIEEYKEGLEIDRRDNDGPYCKDNCRWVTRNVNMSNRRKWGKCLKGVHERSGSFQSRISINGKRYIIGNFSSPELAHYAYLKVKKEWYGF